MEQILVNFEGFLGCAKIKHVNFYFVAHACVKLHLIHSGSLSILKPATDLPNPNSSLSSVAIKDANEVMKKSPKHLKSRGTYAKITPKKQAAIAQYAVLYGNKTAVIRYGFNYKGCMLFHDYYYYRGCAQAEIKI